MVLMGAVGFVVALAFGFWGLVLMTPLSLAVGYAASRRRR